MPSFRTGSGKCVKPPDPESLKPWLRVTGWKLRRCSRKCWIICCVRLELLEARAPRQTYLSLASSPHNSPGFVEDSLKTLASHSPKPSSPWFGPGVVFSPECTPSPSNIIFQQTSSTCSKPQSRTLPWYSFH